MAGSTGYFGQDLLPYYERELAALKLSAKEFAAEHPLIASRLNLDDSSGEDPHVERLLQGCAYLAARIQRRLHDDYPLFTKALLGLVYPQLTRPIPSFSVASFETDYAGKGVTDSRTIGAGASVRLPSSNGVQCTFRTCYPVDLVPVSITECQLVPVERAPASYALEGASAVLLLKLKAAGDLDVSSLKLKSLRFYLDLGADAFDLHELLFNRALNVLVRRNPDEGTSDVVRLGRDALQPVGFDPAEALLERDERHLDGYRLLMEYFCFPQKFFFADVVGLESVLSSPCKAFEIAVPVKASVRPERLADLYKAVRRQSLRLACSPIANLFEHSAVPIRTAGQRQGYAVVPKGRPRSAFEVYAIQSVVRLRSASGRDDGTPIKPLFSFSGDDTSGTGTVFWVEHRRSAESGESKGTEVDLDFLYRDGAVPESLEDTFAVNFLASNRDVPASLPFPFPDEPRPELIDEGGVDRVRCLVKPTPTIRTHLETMSRWQFVSHLSLNHLSLVEGGEESLRGILGLYNFRGAAEIRRQINALEQLSTTSVVRPMGDAAHRAFVRGLRVELTIDESGFSGANPYLFSAILSRLFESFCAINTFVELAVFLKNREGEFASWTPMLGRAPSL